ncbi:MAG: hypothetical protein ABR537_14210 [Gemmatimonadales bacterium]
MTRAVQWLSGWAVRTAIGVAVLLTVQPPHRLTAQVGHDPADSPFRDILLHSGLMVSVGHLSADRGRTGAGMSNALTIGLRYEIPAGHSLAFQFTSAFLDGDRFIIDPRADSSSPQRRTGPYKSDVALAELGLQLRLTGGKTWHGIAPYVGTALGMLFDVNSPGDTTGSGYKFGTKVALSGSTGVRWYPARRVLVNADLRAQLWRLKYPLAFHGALSPDGSRVVPSNQPLTDWTLHPWISLGIGWTF